MDLDVGIVLTNFFQSMVNTRRNGQPNGSSDDDIEIPNLEAMVADAIANMLPGLNANEVVSRIINDVRDALNLWKAHKQGKGGGVYMTTCTWAKFRSTFYKRYFPDSKQQRFEREYNAIHQKENENSGEYMQRFLRIASFVRPIAGDASRQAKHFKWGLKGWVLDRLLNTEFADVSAVNDAARNIEIFHEGSCTTNVTVMMTEFILELRVMITKGIQAGVMIRGDRWTGVTTSGVSQAENYDYKRQDTRGQDSKSTGRNGNDRQGQGYNQRQYRDQPTRGSKSGRTTGSSVQQKLVEGSQLPLLPPLLCPTCSKPHPGPGHRITGACFNCGSTNHRVKYCPKRNPSAPVNTITSGQVFTTTRDQAAGTSGTNTGI
ncbi:zinc finger, CCHC-type, Retrotransposon gag domain protein [Artemisia annua]|uniref:Zinc finger, CCHC-type, Retrotransposon gag domain protein n=1 Tax=Artemisia annua TaxID=35608 RepID=A0A2U1NY83_ARTAN|nr:zinc finger, CCHC-type, Retrotransposon gag domain protein [Artemisia annua]